MALTYKRVSEAREYDKLIEQRCDLCGRLAKVPGSRWDGDGFAVSETEVRLKEGRSYPEGGSGSEHRVDICPDCFRAKLIPWLESQGAAISERDWDF